MMLQLRNLKIKGRVIYCSAREKMARRIELLERGGAERGAEGGGRQGGERKSHHNEELKCDAAIMGAKKTFKFISSVVL
jgi:hypothetical protein